MLLLTVAYFQYICFYSPVLLLPFIYYRNIGFSRLIESSAQPVNLINENYIYPVGDFTYYIIQSSLVETITIYFILPIEKGSTNLIYFIPMSFFFEIVLDFFYYWIHRALHVSHYSAHKLHHEHIHLKPVIHFYQDIVDLFLTIVLPLVFTVKIVEQFYSLSHFEISVLLTYKIITEVSGHSGHRTFPFSSFPQADFIPKLLGIELYSEDHNLHHSQVNYNFSKRFILWDKVFGTYKSPVIQT